MNDFKPILVAVDFGSPSDRAFEFAMSLAERMRAPLEVVHVHPPVPASFPDDGLYTASARERLGQLVAQATERGIAARAHLEAETPVFGLLHVIDRLQPLLVIVGSHGRRGIERALLGSVSDALAHRSPVPVIIVPAPARQAVAERAAWYCEGCGHILADGETTLRCMQCGSEAPRWKGAPINSGPVDAGEPASGESVAPDLLELQTRDPASTFAVAPAGVEGYDVNPELRVRY